MRHWRLLVLPLVFVLVFGLIVPRPAQAQTPDTGISLQISPLPIELSTKPGTTTSTDLRVRNGGTKDEQLQVHVLRVTEDDNGQVHLTEPRLEDDWVKWITFSKDVFDAPPGEWQTIRMTVDVPSSAAFGYYFAVEYMRATPEAPQPGRQVARGAVATFVLLNADAPGAKREANITSFSVNKKLFEFLPSSFTVKIRGSGNVHVTPHGNIFIMNGKKQVDAITVNAIEGSILPQSSRFFTSDWTNGFPHYEAKTNNGQQVYDKKGNPAQTLKWDFSKANRLRFGHYTANLFMVYDNGQRDVPIQASVSFWVVPWRVLAFILIFILLAGFGIWSIGRPFIKKIRKAKKTSSKNEEKPAKKS